MGDEAPTSVSTTAFNYLEAIDGRVIGQNLGRRAINGCPVRQSSDVIAKSAATSRGSFRPAVLRDPIARRHLLSGPRPASEVDQKASGSNLE
jgi:hypothetical protein